MVVSGIWWEHESALRRKCCGGNFFNFSVPAGVGLSSCFTCEFLLLLRLFHFFYILLSRFQTVFQVVFRASLVSRREAIIDLYAAMLKDRGWLSLPVADSTVRDFNSRATPFCLSITAYKSIVLCFVLPPPARNLFYLSYSTLSRGSQA